MYVESYEHCHLNTAGVYWVQIRHLAMLWRWWICSLCFRIQMLCLKGATALWQRQRLTGAIEWEKRSGVADLLLLTHFSMFLNSKQPGKVCSRHSLLFVHKKTEYRKMQFKKELQENLTAKLNFNSIKVKCFSLMKLTSSHCGILLVKYSILA